MCFPHFFPLLKKSQIHVFLFIVTADIQNNIQLASAWPRELPATAFRAIRKGALSEKESFLNQPRVALKKIKERSATPLEGSEATLGEGEGEEEGGKGTLEQLLLVLGGKEIGFLPATPQPLGTLGASLGLWFHFYTSRTFTARRSQGFGG